MEQNENTIIKLESEIETMLRNLGISCHLKCYQYLKTAIMLCIRDFTLIDNITTELYPIIAQKYKTTSSNVEHAILNAIKKGWQKRDLEFVQSLFGSISLPPTNLEFIATIADELTPKQELEKKIATILRNLGIPCHVKGYQYLQTAILLCIKDYTLINNITTKLYPIIAQKYTTTPLHVERAIYNAIKMEWKRADLELFNSIFGCDSKPTNSEFIATIVDEFSPKQELEKKIATMLRNLGIPYHLVGYQYLCSAILLCIEDFTLISNTTKNLYLYIAEKYKTTPLCIRRAIYYAIEVAWQENDSMKSIFGNKRKPKDLEFIATIVDEFSPKQELEKKIETTLRNLGIPYYLVGYQYLQSAILLHIEDCTLIQSITKEFYPCIAKKHKTKSFSVERAIRYAIEVAWQKNDSMKSMFKFRDSRPANSEFIVTIASKLNETI